MLNGQIALHTLQVDDALRHFEQAVELAPESLAAKAMLGADHPLVRTARFNACNFAIRLCPEPESAAVLEEAVQAARALESTVASIGHMQRAFYFQLTGDDHVALSEWRKAVDRCGTGVFASWYAAAAYVRNRSAEALEVLDRLKPSTDGLMAVARAWPAWIRTCTGRAGFRESRISR
jgi:hypothetical protein